MYHFILYFITVFTCFFYIEILYLILNNICDQLKKIAPDPPFQNSWGVATPRRP